jgi:ribosome modulation factor
VRFVRDLDGVHLLVFELCLRWGLMARSTLTEDAVGEVASRCGNRVLILDAVSEFGEEEVELTTIGVLSKVLVVSLYLLLLLNLGRSKRDRLDRRGDEGATTVVEGCSWQICVWAETGATSGLRWISAVTVVMIGVGVVQLFTKLLFSTALEVIVFEEADGWLSGLVVRRELDECSARVVRLWGDRDCERESIQLAGVSDGLDKFVLFVCSELQDIELNVGDGELQFEPMAVMTFGAFGGCRNRDDEAEDECGSVRGDIFDVRSEVGHNVSSLAWNCWLSRDSETFPDDIVWGISDGGALVDSSSAFRPVDLIFVRFEQYLYLLCNFDLATDAIDGAAEALMSVAVVIPDVVAIGSTWVEKTCGALSIDWLVFELVLSWCAIESESDGNVDSVTIAEEGSVCGTGSQLSIERRIERPGTCSFGIWNSCSGKH